MPEAKFDLFVHEGKVWENDGEDERPYEGPWPVVVWFTAVDVLDGNGWGRKAFERHGKVLDHYPHDVGSGDETEAVLVEVKTLEGLLALCEDHELHDEKPARL